MLGYVVIIGRMVELVKDHKDRDDEIITELIKQERAKSGKK
ncbi:MAG: hypothetical protein AB1485_00020 [Candidatus Thermoplasmatota archaeon]